MALIGAAFGIGFYLRPLLGFASLFVDAAGARASPPPCSSLLALGMAWKATSRNAAGWPAQAVNRRWLDWSGPPQRPCARHRRHLIFTFFLATFAFGAWIDACPGQPLLV